MKSTILALSALLTVSSPAVVDHNYQIEFLKNASGAISFTGSWVMIFDSNGDRALPGGLNAQIAAPNSYITNAQTALADFAGVSLTEGTMIGGDTIYDIGTLFEAEPNIISILGHHAFADEESGASFAMYWFPGVTEGSTLGNTFEIMGIFDSRNPIQGDQWSVGTVVQTPGDIVTTVYFPNTPPNFPTGAPDASFTAILVPEMSSMSFAVIGLALAARRKRA